MPTPTYIVTDRHGGFLFRIAIPKDLRADFSGKHSYRKSLRTRHRPTAIKRARRLAVLMEDLFAMAKKKYQREQMISRGKVSVTKAKLNEIEDNLTRDQLQELQSPTTELTPELTSIIDEITALQFDLEEKEATLEQATADVEIANNAERDIREKQRLEQIVSEVEQSLEVPAGYTYGTHTATQTTEPPSPPSPLFSELWIEYRERKIKLREWKTESSKQRSRLKERDSEFRDFLEIIDDMPASDFNKGTTIRLIDGLLSLPLNRTKRYKDTPLKDIPANAEKISPETAAHRLNYLKGFFKFLEKEEYIGRNRLQDESIESNPKSYATPSPTDIKEWFNLKEELITHAWQFWIPRIAIYSGARQLEIAQLKPKDIKHDPDTGILYFVIQDTDAGNSTKSSASNRLVPLHSQLINNGFMDYYEAVKLKHTDTLWPSLKEKLGSKAPNVSDYWADLRDKHKVLSEPAGEFGHRKVFHSLRRVIINRLLEAGVNLETIQCIVGHEPSMGITKRYIDNPAPLPAKKEATEKLLIENVSWSHPCKLAIKG